MKIVLKLIGWIVGALLGAGLVRVLLGSHPIAAIIVGLAVLCFMAFSMGKAVNARMEAARKEAGPQ